MTLDNMGWNGPRYDDYTSVAYWYQTLPSAPLMPLPTDAETVSYTHLDVYKRQLYSFVKK